MTILTSTGPTYGETFERSAQTSPSRQVHAPRKRRSITNAVVHFVRELADVFAEARELRRTMHKRHPFIEL